MRILSALLSCLLWFSCITTKGVTDSQLTDTEPYHFVYVGDVDEMRSFLKRTLIENGFLIENDDVEAGFIVTQPKVLSEYESYDMLGWGIKNQHGIVFIVYRTKTDYTHVRLDCRLQAELGQHYENIKGAFGRVAQGHPFAMRYRSILEEHADFHLVRDPELIAKL